MLCNILTIIIILLIIIIIGVIVLKGQDQVKQPIELVSGDLIESFEYNSGDVSTQIMQNNDKIINLIKDLETIKPELKLRKYDPNIIYTDFGNSINTGLTTINEIPQIYNNKTLDKSQQIDKLESNIKDMEIMIRNLGLSTIQDKQYNTIKSLNNGMEIGLISTSNTVFQDHKTGSNIAAYMIGINDGCLSVGANDYDVYKCDDKNPKMLFKMEHILNSTAYGKNIDTSLPADINSNLNNINYPFVLMKSVNNENCLTNNHGSLTVQPCYTYQAQRWFPLETKQS